MNRYLVALMVLGVAAPTLAQQPPNASAGPDQPGQSLEWIGMDARATTDPDTAFGSLSFSWTQVLGVPVTLYDASTPVPYFRSPNVALATILEFELTVTDPTSLSDTDRARVTLQPAPVSFTGDPQSLLPYDAGPGQLTYDEALHFLMRATFGPTPDQVAYLQQVGVTVWVMEQLTKTTSMGLYTEALAYANVNPAEDKTCNGKVFHQAYQGQAQDYIHYLIRHDQDALLKWRMMYFLMDRWACSTASLVQARRHFRIDLVDIYESAWKLTDYRQFAKDISIAGAMLDFLDLEGSTGTEPNENYARELVELYTMGVYDVVTGGTEYNYTEEDIREMSNAMTGWRIEPNVCGLVLPIYRSIYHNTNGPFPIQLGSGESIVFVDSVDEVVNAIFTRPQTARWLAYNLFRTFCHFDPDPATIDELAGEIETFDFDCRNALRTLLESEAMFSPEARKSQVMRPLDFVLGMHRRLALDDEIARIVLRDYLDDSRHSLLNPTSVYGWAEDDSWISQDAMIRLMNAANEYVKRNSASNDNPDLDSLVRKDPGLNDKATFISRFARAWGIDNADLEPEVFVPIADYMDDAPPFTPHNHFDLNWMADVRAQGLGAVFDLICLSLANAR